MFNKNLLKYFHEKQRALVELVLFAINADIPIDDYITNNKNILESIGSWKDDILGDVQEIIRQLNVHNIIEENYEENKNTRWKLIRPYFVTNLETKELSDDLIKILRSYFGKKYCNQSRFSTRKIVREQLTIFLEINPDIDIELLEPVFKYYVDSKLEADSNGQYVANIINFITGIDRDGKPLELSLETAIEEWLECKDIDNFLKSGIDI